MRLFFYARSQDFPFVQMHFLSNLVFAKLQIEQLNVYNYMYTVIFNISKVYCLIIRFFRYYILALYEVE